MLGQLTLIKQEDRDQLLRRYIARCKIIFALAFFQWRTRTEGDLDDDQKYENSVSTSQEIFDARVKLLIDWFEIAQKRKKAAAEEKKEKESQPRKVADRVIRSLQS